MYGIIGSGAGGVTAVAIGQQVPGPAGQALAVTGFAFAAYVVFAVALIVIGLILRVAGGRQPSRPE